MPTNQHPLSGFFSEILTDQQLAQIQSQLPFGAVIQRWYRACEGDVRVIVRLPGMQNEVRYTVFFVDEHPCIRLMD